MRNVIATINACALLAGASCFAQAQSDSGAAQSGAAQSGSTQSGAAQSAAAPVAVGEIVTASATVDKVDKADRKVTLKTEDGSKETIKVPESVRNFDQIKPGDKVTARYSRSIAVGIRKSDEPPNVVEQESIARAPAGAKPGGEVTETTQISAKVQKIDKNTREVTLMKPDGTTSEVKVPEDVKKFDSLKQGDQVVVNATESMAIEVTPK